MKVQSAQLEEPQIWAGLLGLAIAKDEQRGSFVNTALKT